MSAALWFRLRHLAAGWLDSSATSRPGTALRLEVLEDRTLLAARFAVEGIFPLHKPIGADLPDAAPSTPGMHNAPPARPAPVLVPEAPDRPGVTILPVQLNTTNGLERAVTQQLVRSYQPFAATHAFAFADSAPVQSLQAAPAAARQVLVQTTVPAALPLNPAPLPGVLLPNSILALEQSALRAQLPDSLQLATDSFDLRIETPGAEKEADAPVEAAAIPPVVFVLALPGVSEETEAARAEEAAPLPPVVTQEVAVAAAEQTDATWAVLGTETPVAPVETTRTNFSGELLPILAAIFVTSAVWHLSGPQDRRTTEWPKQK